jgi:hypothetical protein
MGIDRDACIKPTCDATAGESRAGNRSDAAPTAADNAEILKALEQDYASARAEIVLHIQLYKTQERYGTVIVGILGLLIPLLISGNITGQAWRNLKALGPEAVLFGLFTISTVLFHMYFSTLCRSLPNVV